jgi:diaminohydroxyphosphoribosylaminopyrimidine deaminase/5-amino-6-(5-phosphoribosylamino)uracil reductase
VNDQRRAAQDADEGFMRRALTLAERGRGNTRPNPIVGAVIVRDGKVVAEGFHRRAGDAHAEIAALDALARAGGDARGATVYVNLEPCCHTGRTGPCTEAIVAAGLARVVVGCRDPNPKVDGRGLRALRRAGVQVDVGCLAEEARAANRGFFTWVTKRRPLVTLKAAATLDGFIADRAPRRRKAPVWITGQPARAVAHELRASHDAVLVGAGTVAADDPLLTVRLPGTKSARRRLLQPIRVVLDGRLRTSPRAQVLRANGSAAPTIVIGAVGAPAQRVRALERSGAAVELLPARRGRIALRQLLAWLAQQDIQSLLVEGGADVLGAFIDERLVDRVAFFVAPRLLGSGVPLAAGAGTTVAAGLRLGSLSARSVGDDLLLTADVV